MGQGLDIANCSCVRQDAAVSAKTTQGLGELLPGAENETSAFHTMLGPQGVDIHSNSLELALPQSMSITVLETIEDSPGLSTSEHSHQNNERGLVGKFIDWLKLKSDEHLPEACSKVVCSGLDLIDHGVKFLIDRDRTSWDKLCGQWNHFCEACSHGVESATDWALEFYHSSVEAGKKLLESLREYFSKDKSPSQKEYLPKLGFELPILRGLTNGESKLVEHLVHAAESADSSYELSLDRNNRILASLIELGQALAEVKHAHEKGQEAEQVRVEDKRRESTANVAQEIARHPECEAFIRARISAIYAENSLIFDPVSDAELDAMVAQAHIENAQTKRRAA